MVSEKKGQKYIKKKVQKMILYMKSSSCTWFMQKGYAFRYIGELFRLLRNDSSWHKIAEMEELVYIG